MAIGFSAAQTEEQDHRPRIAFVDVSDRVGLRFRHQTGGTGEKHVPETMGSGVVWLDYDNDGAWDLYFIDSGPLPAGPAPVLAETQSGRNVLYRARADHTFAAVARAGVEDSGYGMGGTVADYDGDGWPDLLVTNFGPNALYRNNGDGTFADVTVIAGVGDPRWGTSAAWGDLDHDGFPDLYVANYLAYDPANARVCGRPDEGIRIFCPPQMFDGVADILYRNTGDGRLQDVTEIAGVANASEGKGLGVVIGDADEDGLPDIYVANDSTRNFLYLNRGGFHFEDAGLVSGVGYSEEGQPQSGMGTDFGDLDGDGHMEIVVTNFSFEPNNLYRLLAPYVYLDETFALGLGAATMPVLGFGVGMVDLDGDGDLDLAFANGHIHDHLPDTPMPQPNQVFVNRLTELRAEAIAAGEPVSLGLAATGDELPVGRGSGSAEPGWRPQRDLLTDASTSAGQAIGRPRISRGLAYGDADGDGWPDLAVTNSGGPAELLRNVTPASERRLVLRLRGRLANRDALGAPVWVTPSGAGAEGAGEGSVGFPQLYEVKSASSYLSQNATDLYVGLGAATAAAIAIQWPGGEWERVGPVQAGQLALIVEGRGVVATARLAARSLGEAR